MPGQARHDKPWEIEDSLQFQIDPLPILFRAGFKRKIPLGDITENNNYRNSKHLCQYRVNFENLNKYLQEQIIQRKIKHTDHKIPEKLYAAFHVRVTEHNIFRHKKAYRKSNEEWNEQRCYMGFECKKTEIKILFMKQVFIADKIN